MLFDIIIILVARKPSVLAGAGNAARTKIVYHAVTENFIHCEIVSDKAVQENHAVYIRIKSVLSERIKKGGDIEAAAEFI